MWTPCADPAAILVIDETGFLKKGTKSAGVQRQYCGTAGKLDNCQVGVFLTYSSLLPAQTQVLVDRELYLPEEWAGDVARRREAGVPDDVAFATKPELARRLLERARVAGLPAAWVTGDTVDGGSTPLRAWLEEQRQPYVLAIAANDRVDLPTGDQTSMHVLPKEIAAYALDPHEWRRLSAGDSSKGARLYDWAFVPLAPPTAAGFEQALLIRRPLNAPDDPKKLAYYLTFAPQGALVETLVAVAGRRWAIEESLEAAKGEVGLDHYEVRHYHGWYRHITLAMLALAYLAVVRSHLPGSALKGGVGRAAGRPRRLDPAHHSRGPSARLPPGRARPRPTGGGAALVALASPPPSPRHAQPLPAVTRSTALSGVGRAEAPMIANRSSVPPRRSRPTRDAP
jgi:SRSO17 transposase